MAKVSIEIDTQGGDLKKEGVRLAGLGGQGPLTADKLGILSSVKMTNNLLKAIRAGYGGPTEYEDNITPNDLTDLTNRKNILVSKQCTVFATVGGLWANIGLSGSTLPFVSLVGSIPGNPDPNCCGGVSLEGWRSNPDRRNYLKNNYQIQAANVGLYHSGPPPHAGPGTFAYDEEQEWTGAGAGAITRSTGNFAADLAGVATTALVIGASPPFSLPK
jgi:hypothetical protein